MSLPSHARRKLKEALGDDASEAVMSWIDDIDSRRDELAQVGESVAAVRLAMQIGSATLDATIARGNAQLVRWSFVFWTSAVLSIAALARVLGP
jgi:hypothetical protein